MSFQLPWQHMGPFQPGQGRQQHVEYLDHHPKPENDRVQTVQLHVDNRDRDAGFDAHRGASAPFNFVVRFDPVSEVVSAEVKALYCPRPVGETYVVLDIPQLGDGLHSTDMNSHQKYAVAYFDQPVSISDIKPIKADMVSGRTVTFEAPRTLSRLDVAIRTHGGALLAVPDGSSTNVSLWLELKRKQVSDLYGV